MGLMIFVLIINILAVSAVVYLVVRTSRNHKRDRIKLKKPDYNYLRWLEDKWDKEEK